MKSNLTVFVDRLKKIGIEVSIVGNFPWIYMTSVNGRLVEEKLHSKHGFTIAFASIRPSDNNNVNFTDIKKMFEIIRRYR